MRVRTELRTVIVQKSGECPRTLRFSDKVRRMSESPENVREHSDFQIKSGECPKVRRMFENTPIFRQSPENVQKSEISENGPMSPT